MVVDDEIGNVREVLVGIERFHERGECSCVVLVLGVIRAVGLVILDFTALRRTKTQIGKPVGMITGSPGAKSVTDSPTCSTAPPTHGALLFRDDFSHG
ncbi:hypothetical protein CH253_18720 [Rhodococcus sp. 06-156-3C]|uniref:hypothetical protein n=1 Tax=Nocardiaceae TaxID=85025 RepID=UPI00068CC8CC|nr:MULTISPECIES: hypothetical protein [Rhodococcus]OZD13094.1 hypothetical protein CH248_27920 [Rhodococcus sp. 06-156-4a]OZD17963.1 hypothetical protein CH253_18720 [Rhodococcus sp. 06-156-3C]OZD20687.1 hypothetical protein CH280_03875 [Rhodococcus sp. 06-156-4C]OZD30594.1 hypothetical protein CH247_14855 [Rhodococcus sp. 06-156-3b]OZD32633.1 hypothetical protein CH284_20405 [Rhodococcus sp. 06-156-3]